MHVVQCNDWEYSTDLRIQRQAKWCRIECGTLVNESMNESMSVTQMKQMAERNSPRDEKYEACIVALP